jgi:hypothetical protein
MTQDWNDEKNRDGKGRVFDQRSGESLGEKITGLFSAEIVTINNEKSVLSSINDITERKRAEGEREKLIAELKEAFPKSNS